MIEAQMDNGNQSNLDNVSQPVENVRVDKTFTQSDVDDIVKRAKNDAVESFKKMQIERPDYLARKHPDAIIPQNNQIIPEDSLRRIAAEEAQRLRDQWVQEAQARSQEELAKKTVESFYSKINTGKSKYDDFDKVTGDIDLSRFPNVVELLGNYIDNSGDVLYHLGNDRIKLGQLEMLSRESPQDAIVAAKKLADSLRLNEEASQVRQPREPLSQMRPSNNGTGTDSALSVRDYRRKYRV